MLNIILRYLLIVFYLFAGINHFIDPKFYLPLMPDYLPAKSLLNIAAGVAECSLAILVAFPKTRKIGGAGIILMLIAFLPVHIYFVQVDSCIEGAICVDPWMGWARLILIQPLLILWAWWVGFKS